MDQFIELGLESVSHHYSGLTHGGESCIMFLGFAVAALGIAPGLPVGTLELRAWILGLEGDVTGGIRMGWQLGVVTERAILLAERATQKEITGIWAQWLFWFRSAVPMSVIMSAG